MLVAQRQNGELFSLGDLTDRNTLVHYRRKEKFFCPECGEMVILKLGNKRIWHFSHQQGASCPQLYERESDFHLSGKFQLYHWLKENGIQAELERYIPECKQRADLAFRWGQTNYVLEFQCSAINEELMNKRTKGYTLNGFIPIWILGGNQVRRITSNVVSFNHFHYQFLQKKKSGLFLPAYCPESRQFIFLHDPIPISSKKAVVSMAALPRGKTQLFDLLAPKFNFRFSVETWMKELQKLKNSYYMYPDPLRRSFLNELYMNRLNLHTLPPEIGLPVLSAPYLETPPLVWQLYLYFDIFRHLKSGNVTSCSNVYNSILLRINKKQIKTRCFPLYDKGCFREAIDEYLNLLVRISAVKQVDKNNYQMLRPFQIPESVDTQINDEKNFYRKYKSELMKI